MRLKVQVIFGKNKVIFSTQSVKKEGKDEVWCGWFYSFKVFIKTKHWKFPGCLVVGSLFPPQGTRVQPLVGKLRSWIPQGAAKKKKKKERKENLGNFHFCIKEETKLRNEGVGYLRKVEIFWKYHYEQFCIQEIEAYCTVLESIWSSRTWIYNSTNMWMYIIFLH